MFTLFKWFIFDKSLSTDEINLKQTRLEILTLVFDSFEIEDNGNLFVDPKSRFPSYQGDSAIFHKGNFLKLKGVELPHPPLS